jgi:succinate dehydrogenase / fumarate reductase cytochrome b subunit
MKQSRPIYLDLLRIRQPLPAMISLLHRISGVLLFLAIPLMLIAFQDSLASPERFHELQQSSKFKFSLFFLFAAYGYHFFAGLRFLLLDLHCGVALKSARLTSWAVLGASLLGLLLLGAWLW